MTKDKFGQMIYTPDEVFDILMHDINPNDLNFQPGPFTLEEGKLDIKLTNEAAGYEAVMAYDADNDVTVEEFDKRNQAIWFMPDSYKEMDVAKYILDLCKTDAELQRCGEELLLFMERDLFDILRYMVYLVDTMRLNDVIWGVGRGSSVSSYVLYLLGVHKIDSMYYKLDPREFLR